MATFTEILGTAGVTCPDTALADLAVPVLSGPQRQGDVLVIPTDDVFGEASPITTRGVAVVRGEATGNTHLLMGDGTWTPGDPSGAGVLLGYLTVPDGGEAWLIHTDEHGVNGIGPGRYRLHGKRELADEIRRVQD